MPLDLKKYAAKLRITDGAWGTELQKRGLKAGACPELLNVESPAAVEAVARTYVQAGSDVILTNTFGGNRFVLAAHGASDRVAELVAAGVAISRKAAGKKAKVFASVGPTGKIVMMGEQRPEEFAAAFAESAAAIAAAGADAVVLESFNELQELKIALKAVKGACDLPVVACMTFASGPRKTSTMMGDSPADLATAGAELGADAVGANCGCGPDNYIYVAALLRAATALPIWIKANAGLPVVKDGRTTFPMGPADFAARAGALAAAGANFIGGCCGTTADHVRALRTALIRDKRR